MLGEYLRVQVEDLRLVARLAPVSVTLVLVLAVALAVVVLVDGAFLVAAIVVVPVVVTLVRALVGRVTGGVVHVPHAKRVVG